MIQRIQSMGGKHYRKEDQDPLNQQWMRIYQCADGIIFKREWYRTSAYCTLYSTTEWCSQMIQSNDYRMDESNLTQSRPTFETLGQSPQCSTIPIHSRTSTCTQG